MVGAVCKKTPSYPHPKRTARTKQRIKADGKSSISVHIRHLTQ